MSADSFHHQVKLSMERRHGLHDYFDFLSCVEEARSGNVELKDMQFSDFYKWKDLKSDSKLKRYLDSCFKNMVAIKAVRGHYTLFYKTSHKNNTYEVLDFLQLKALKHGLIMPEQ